MGIAGLNNDGSLKSYIENTIVSNNIIEDSSIIYRINCKGSHIVKITHLFIILIVHHLFLLLISTITKEAD